MSPPDQEEEVERLAKFGIKFYRKRRKDRFRLVKQVNFTSNAYRDEDFLASVAAMIVEAKSEKSSG